MEREMSEHRPLEIRREWPREFPWEEVLTGWKDVRLRGRHCRSDIGGDSDDRFLRAVQSRCPSRKRGDGQQTREGRP